ncbi:hypothetical protein D3875_02865 [Deinococcus cavernae]|uniref:VRR-NUC domain-containing protein n=1 Tax=Deinococcus cavernae TaxID=2320857 RepID=A0A418VEA9_9DEIO|nr:hypothetical protein [Deinococcus cavernae]RJF74442.1 hypothetical protein D3875_03965 [Deinococcus cavernae]RJF74954.1 hypothetical protein D3875_02865 [Deinococcus cavernae]
MPRRPTRTVSEAQIEQQVREVFARRGYLSVKTEAGKSGHRLPVGFPDGLAFLPVRGTRFALVALVELKTRSGKLSPDQVKYHALLRSHALQPLIIRDAESADALAAEGRELRRRIEALLQENP